MEITCYQSVKAVDQYFSSTVQNWIQQIRDRGMYHSMITQAREARTTNPALYKKIKTGSLPVFMPNFIYSGPRNDRNMKASTGLLYFDYDCGEIECADELKETITSNPYVFAAWKSLSATGLGVLVKVTGMPSDRDEFATAYNEVGTAIGLPGWDPAAVNRGRCNVLSHDESAYLNETAITFEVKVKVTSNLHHPPVCSHFHFSEEESADGGRLITKSQLDFYPSDCVYLPEGHDYYSCFIPYGADGRPKKIQSGQRQAILSAFCHNLVCLNRTATEFQILSLMKAINSYHCSNPLGATELIAIVKTKHARRESLIPIGITKKKYWVRPGASSALSAYHTARRERSIALIFEFIGDQLLNLDHKVTKNTIQEFTGLSLPTIRSIVREYPEIEDEMRSHNKKLKK